MSNAWWQDEIATVMGHEMAHALKEHGKKARNIGVFTSVLGAIGDAAASVALGVDTGGLVQTGVAVGVDMPYSRSNAITRGNKEYMYTSYVCIYYYYKYHIKKGYTFGYEALQIVKNDRKWYQFWKPKYKALESYGYRTNTYDINKDE